MYLRSALRLGYRRDASPLIFPAAGSSRPPLQSTIRGLATLQIAIHGEGPCASEAEREEPRDVQQVGLITGLTKVRARRVVGHKLDRAEPVRKMDGEDRSQQHHDHRHGSDGHTGT